MNTLNELIAERNQYLGERAKVYDLVQDIFQGLVSDHENGVKWLNEVVSAQWMREHRCTNEAIQKLAKFVEDWGPVE